MRYKVIALIVGMLFGVPALADSQSAEIAQYGQTAVFQQAIKEAIELANDERASIPELRLAAEEAYRECIGTIDHYYVTEALRALLVGVGTVALITNNLTAARIAGLILILNAVDMGITLVQKIPCSSKLRDENNTLSQRSAFLQAHAQELAGKLHDHDKEL